MKSYVNPGEQLVVALYVRNIKKSSEFYRSYGFEVVRDEGTFMELRWEDARLFLSAVPGTPPPPDADRQYASHGAGCRRILDSCQ